MCFMGSGLLGSHHRIFHAFLHFYWLSPMGIMYNHKYRVFHPRGYISLLAITYHTFFHVMQSCDSIKRRPTVPSPPSNTKHSVDPYHALMSCDVPVHICNAMRHCVPIPCNMYNECYMDNQAHAFHHASWIIIIICI